jgi:hypothetical protein
MKQNEKILVYAVTGFLAVILMIAVVFGKADESRAAGESDSGAGGEIGAAPSLEELLDQRTDAAAVNQPSPADDAIGGRPLVANVQLPPPTPAALVAEQLGLSRQEHGFRIVRARAGDTLSGLVHKWCAGQDGSLEAARACNEELSTLRVGQDVVLPWVDDEVLLAAHEARKAGGAPATAPDAPAAALAGLPADDGRAGAAGAPAAPRKHTIAAGESLWKIAEREVGRNGVNAYLQQLRELNPGLDAQRLRVGQQIVLPPKS